MPGWVTLLGQVNHLGTRPATQVNSHWAIPPWVGKMSTSESWEVNRHITLAYIRRISFSSCLPDG